MERKLTVGELSMGEAAFQAEYVSEEEYLDFEQKSDIKHEYWNGYVVATAGAMPNHAILAHQLAHVLNTRLDDTPCLAVGGDSAVRLEADSSYVYPDVLVWCDDALFDERFPAILLTPIAIAEVLSPSTAAIDRGAKLEAYLRIPSLMDYLILSPNRVSIEHYTRGEDGSWPYRYYDQRNQRVRLPRLNIEFSVGELYRRLDVPEGFRLVPGAPEIEL